MDVFTLIIGLAGAFVGAGLIVGAIGACFFFLDRE